MKTFWTSWATTMTTTPGSVAVSRYWRTWSSLRSSHRERSGVFRCSTGIRLLSAKVRTASRKRSPMCLNSVGEGDRVAKMTGQEGDHLTGDLQFWDIAIEVDPVKALEVQH